MQENKKSSNWFWPSITDRESAIRAASSGFWAAVIVAVVTALITTVVLAAKLNVLSIDEWAYLDAAIFAFIAWRIRRYSRVFAVIGVLLFVAERVDMVVEAGPKGFSIFSIIVLLMFINGARGVFGYHRYAQEPALEEAV